MDPTKLSTNSPDTCTWRSLIAAAFKGDDSFDNIEAVNLLDGRASDRQWLDVEFTNGWGTPSAAAFIMWTHRYVYFPVDYDGIKTVARISRNPDQSRPRVYGHV